MYKRLLLLLLSLFIISCSSSDNDETTEINGYKDFTWDLSIEQLKEVINKKYNGNLYEYFTMDTQDDLSYHFHSGEFLSKSVEMWDAEFSKGVFKKLKIFINQQKEDDYLFIAEKLKFSKKKIESKSQIISKTIYSKSSNKPVTKILLEKKTINNHKILLITLTNLN